MQNPLLYKRNSVYPETLNKLELPTAFTVDSWCVDLNSDVKNNNGHITYVESLENNNILNHFWFKTKDRARRNSKWIILACLVVIILLTIALIIVANQKEKSKICLSADCIQFSSNIWTNIDDNIDPCTDFYNFACGNYLKDTILSDDVLYHSKEITVANVVFKELKLMLEQPLGSAPKSYNFVKNLYSICLNDVLNEEGEIQNAKAILRKVGTWPMFVGNSWKENSWNLPELIYNLRAIGVPHDYFFIFRVDIDVFNTTRHTILMDAVSSLSHQEFSTQMKKYPNPQDLINLLTLFGADRATAEKDIIPFLKFKESLLQILVKKEKNGIYSTVRNLQTVVPEVNWLQYLTKVANSHEITITEQDKVYINSVSATYMLRQLLRQTPKRVQANYVFVEIVTWMFQFLVKIRAKYQRNIPLWKQCVSDITASMGLALNSWYIKTYFNPDIKVEVGNLLSTIREEFTNVLETSEWLDEPTKANATAKFNLTNVCIGYPEELLDDRNINNHYYKLKINLASYLNAMMSINAFEHDQQFNRLHQPANDFKWIDNSLWTTTINVINIPVLNTIRFSAAYLKNGVYKSGWPYYIKYALVGVILGHEITHGFDQHGRKYDKNGNLLNWWSEEALTSFQEKAQCFTNQYQKYVEPSLNKTVNGVLTQAENIADTGGLKQAYLAYNNWVIKNNVEQTLPGLNYTQNQLFWIAFAQNLCTYYSPTYLQSFMTTDQHSPSRFRVIGSLSNMEGFGKDFNCPLGSPMNPRKKCTMW